MGTIWWQGVRPVTHPEAPSIHPEAPGTHPEVLIQDRSTVLPQNNRCYNFVFNGMSECENSYSDINL